ncbi:hypothetical protein DM860_014755 [Cuscuta australis]|uniref:Uncharacterized protein n=1 Tax=Cuscuta australis TaxID=267555 RepID=A0A328D3H8_9ASTE|nr:hypothetical protein DM860_014755 [Cuscuta australis]
MGGDVQLRAIELTRHRIVVDHEDHNFRRLYNWWILSFNYSSLGPVPSWWKGEYKSGKNFNVSSCNRKLIGARYFSKGYEAALGPIDESKESNSPRDDDDDGTHASSMATGSLIPDAGLLGSTSGSALGMASRARVAVYMVCWVGGCFSADIFGLTGSGMDSSN